MMNQQIGKIPKTDQVYDVIIIGGGIMGCSVAYHLLKADHRIKLAVVERDPTYRQASTSLSMSNARVQFSLRENILVSRYTLEVLNRFEEEMAVEDRRPRLFFRPEGNLFLVEPGARPESERALALQQSLGCRVNWFSPEEITAKYPLYHTAGMAGGTYGAEEGHFDANAFLMGYRYKARSMGAHFIADTVIRIDTQNGRATGVLLDSGYRLKAGHLVNCAGAWASEVARTAAVELPVQPVKRQVYVLDTAVKPPAPLPLTVLPSGLYFRSETGGLILLGKSMPEDPVGIDFNWDDKRFTEILWPELATFVPAFDTLKLLRGWAGLYAVNTLDGNAILGEWPELKGFYLANGFSGHGLQQAPAVGRYLGELITGRPPTLDLSIFGPARILEGRPISEQGIV